MSESQQKSKNSHLLLNVVMIILETIYSFILKHDRVVHLQSKKFVEQQLTVRINSYIPYFDFYIQFTDKGILFDLKAPEQTPQLSVSSTLLDLIQIFAFGNKRSIKKLRIEGDKVLKDEFKDLVLHLSAPKLLSDWKTWLTSSDGDQLTTASNKRIEPLLEKIDTQRSQINTLQVEVKQYKNRIRKMESRQKHTNILLGIISVLFTILIVYNIWKLF